MERVMSAVAEYLISQSWQVAIIFVLVAGACWLLRNASAHWRYLLWCVVVAKCLVPPLFDVSLAVLPAEEAVERRVTYSGQVVTEYGEAVEYEMVSTDPIVEVYEISVGEYLWYQAGGIGPMGWVGIGWIAVAMMFAVAMLFKTLRTNRWVKSNRRELSGAMLGEAEQLCQEMGIKRGVRVWVVEGISQPFVWGWLRGEVYLPVDFEVESGGTKFRSVLMHELSHVKRKDAAVNLLQTVVQVIYFFHPLVWWVNVMLRREREKCCDEMVIAQSQVTVKEYGKAIVDVLVNEYEKAKPVPVLAVAGPVKNIEERVKTMMQVNRKFYRRPSVAAVLSVMFVAALTLPLTVSLTAQGGESDKPAATEEQSIPDGLTISPNRKLLDERTLMELNNLERHYTRLFVVEGGFAMMSAEDKTKTLREWGMRVKDWSDTDLQVQAAASLGNVADRRGMDALIKVVDPANGHGSNEPRYIAARGLGRIGDYRAVPILIKVLDHRNRELRLYARVALCEITGVYWGKSKQRWQQWWKKEGRKYMALRLSSPAATVISFTKAAAEGDVNLALACFAPDSHDRDDFRELMTRKPYQEMRSLLVSIDQDVKVRIIKTTQVEEGQWYDVEWEVTFKKGFEIEGKEFKPGDTFILDGQVKKVGDQWMIVGI